VIPYLEIEAVEQTFEIDGGAVGVSLREA